MSLSVASPVTPLLERLSLDYQQGAGVAGAREVEAARAARALSPSRWQSWGLNAQGQAPQSANAEAGEQQLTLTLTLALGGGPQAQARALELGAQALEVGAARRQQALIIEALSSLKGAWVAQQRAQQLTELSQALHSFASPLLQGEGLSQLDLLDLKLALSNAQSRSHEAQSAVESSLEALRGLLSDELISLVERQALSELPFALEPPSGSPWRALTQQLNALPQLKELERRAQHLEARAEASYAAYPWSLTMGGGVNVIGADRWAMGTLSLSAPLSSPAKAEEARLKLEASAARAERAWAAKRLTAQLEARHRRWERERVRLEQLHTQLALLKSRERLALEAAQAQLLPLPRLLESLEARVSGALELAELQASLWAQLAEAELLSQDAR